MSPSLPPVLPILPFTQNVSGDVVIPGSKSLTNRALLLAALCDRPVKLTGALFSEDTHLMVEALKALGFTVVPNAAEFTIDVSEQTNGFKNAQPVDLFVGLAGTAARFLTALCAAATQGTYRIDGIPQMRKRPMKGLIDALRALGADIRCTGVEGFFPIEIHAKGLRGGAVSIDATESSQMLSALLMVAPLAASPITVTTIGGVRWPFVQMTALIMHAFQPGFAQPGAKPAVDRLDANTFRVNLTPYVPQSSSYAIEPDATAASYYAALPLVTGGALTLLNLHQGLQGDTAFIEVLKRVGLTANASARGLDVSFAKTSASSGNASAAGSPSAAPASAASSAAATAGTATPRIGVDQSFNEFSDTFLTLAAIAPLLSGPTRITGVEHSRRQETDRVAGMVRELRKLGQDVHEHENGDGLTITPKPLKSGVEIETYGDHRFAMSFGILGCHDLHGDGTSWLSIKDPACCAKTFPNFFELLESLRPKLSKA